MMNTNMRRILKTPTLRMQAGGEYDAANAAKLQAFAAASPGLGVAPGPASAAGAGRGDVNPALAIPESAARPMPPAAPPMLRDGNSFGDAAAFRPGGASAAPQSNLQQYAADDVAARGAGMKATSGDWARTTPYAPPGVSPMTAAPVGQAAGPAAAAPARVARGTQAQTWTPMAMPTIGMKDGGSLRTGQGGRVPGTGHGDKIDAKYEPGEFVVSNAMLDAEPGLREQLHGLRTSVLAEKGVTPEQADTKAMSGGTLRAQAGGLFPYNQPEKDIYAGLGKPASAPENMPKPSGMLPPQQLQGAANGQSQTAVASAGPANSGGASGGWGDTGGAAGVPGSAGRAAGAVSRPENEFMPGTKAVFNEGGKDIADAWGKGKYTKAAFTGLRQLATYPMAVADDVIGGAARGALGLLRNPAEDAGRALLGMEDRKPEVAAPPVVKPTAPSSLQLAAQAAAPSTTGTLAPAPAKLGDTREVDEYAGTMQAYTKGNSDKAGWTTVSTPAAKQARGLREQAYDQRLKDDYERATTGPTGWKTVEAERQAREDAATPMNKHQRAAMTSRQGQESVLKAQLAQNQTLRDNNAATVQATREGHALSYSSSVENNQRTIEAAKLAAQRERAYKDRDFDAARNDKALEQSQSAEKAWTEHASAMFRTQDDKGNSIPDANKAAAYTQFVDQGIALMIPRLEKGTPAQRTYAGRLKKEGRAALDAEDKGELPVLFGRQQTHASTAGSGPFASGGASSMDPQDYRITGSDNGLFQDRVKTRGGQTIPETKLRYGPDANGFLWNSGQGSTHLLPNKTRGE